MQEKSTIQERIGNKIYPISFNQHPDKYNLYDFDYVIENFLKNNWVSEFINFQVSNSDSNNGNEKWTLKAWWQRCWSNPSNYSGLTNITRSFSDTEKDVLSDDDIERYENQETEGRNHASSDDDAQWDMFADSKNKMEILLKLWEFQVEKERKNLSSALFVTPFNMYKVKLKINVEMINCWRGNFLIVSFQITGMLVKR